MPDGLYERDVLAWSQHQADLLRRLGRGERVNDVDWAHVAEEIEDVGLSELHSVESFLDLILVHLLKVHVSPGSPAAGHWGPEVVGFQKTRDGASHPRCGNGSMWKNYTVKRSRKCVPISKTVPRPAPCRTPARSLWTTCWQGTAACCWRGWRTGRLDAFGQPALTGTSVMVSLPEMSMTLAATE
jgi:hypothetical protein